MIFQLSVGPSGSTEQPVPFNGPCRVRVVKIDYVFDTAAAITQAVIQVDSNILANSTVLSRRILFFNTTNPYYGKNFEFDTIIPNSISLSLSVFGGGALPAGNGGYLDTVITLDIEEIKQ
jgi:hypothetical protein